MKDKEFYKSRLAACETMLMMVEMQLSDSKEKVRILQKKLDNASETIRCLNKKLKDDLATNNTNKGE